MKKPLTQTKVTVKLRQAVNKSRWYLIVEAYPVWQVGDKKPKRIVKLVNRIVTTPIWDKSTSTRSKAYKPKRNSNGIIMCRSAADQESCIFADSVRKKMQHDYDMEVLYTDEERRMIAQRERGQQDFIKYFKDITYSHHPNSSDSIITNWERACKLLSDFTAGKPIPFNTVSVKMLENIKYFLLSAKQGGNKQGTISKTTASTYFSIIKAALKQAFIDEYLTVDIASKVKSIPVEDSRRETLTQEEVNKLAATPCENDVLRRASLFSILTGMRHCDIKRLRWRMLVRIGDIWRVDFKQKKTHYEEYTPISDQAYELCGERRLPDNLVFEGLKGASWINHPLAKWVEAAGITKHITFHCFRHTFATIQLTNGTDIYTVSKMLGHTNVRTTQKYAKIVDSKKVAAANAIRINGL